MCTLIGAPVVVGQVLEGHEFVSIDFATLATVMSLMHGNSMRFSLQILEVSVGSVWLHVASLLLLPLLYWFAFVLSAFVSLYAYSHSHTSEQCILSSSFILTLQVPLLLFASLCNSIYCMCHFCIVVFASSLERHRILLALVAFDIIVNL